MAINLLNNNISALQNGGQSVQTTGAGTTSALMRQAAAAIMREVSGLTAGDTIQGQLVSKDGNTIELLLGDNARLTTMLEQDMNLSLGQLMSFEVRSNQGGQLTLRPLFANLSNSTTIMNALDAAGIAASDSTVKMVDTLMQNGMPINKDMLQTINRELTMYPDADIKDIVMLHKMDIPVNDANVRQMHLYNNNNQWMLENVSDSATQLTDVLTSALSEGGQGIKNILSGLKELLIPGEEAVTAEGNVLTEEAGANEAGNAGEASAQMQADGNANNVTQVSVNSEQVTDSIKQDVNIANAVTSIPDTNAEEAEAGSKLISNNGENGGDKITEPSINKFNVFDKLNNADPAELARPEIKAQIKNAITELLKDNFLMNPKDIKEEKFVQKYYERTMNLAEGLERLMAENGKGESEFARSMTGMKENTTFMNHINDMYNYVQLPLKMNEMQANGDLYVYARKKGRNAGGEDGKLTALLHLSMEHLGNLDVFLTLSEGQKLNTKFTLEKEEMIDFIASHIDELNARLMKKGYNVATAVTRKDEPDKSVIENITGDKNNILLSTQSFDARA
ncbi:MAG: flagellar hook-length control protein FliK [Lachnospiraceae bacterium]|nr:flagellar hook-length control protein FliK [Lachnospiraceae bacterium]